MTASVRMQAGALSLLAACFFASGLLRAGEVVAALPVVDAAGQSDAQSRPDPTPPAATSATEIVSLAEELRRQRVDLAQREAALAEREELLGSIEKRIRARLAELEQARDELARAASLVDRAAEKDVGRLAEMYRRMKPKEAGQIFDAMAPGFAAGFLAQIGPDSAASILASMNPEKAYAVSVLLAGRSVERN